MCITNPLKISDFQGNLLHMLLFSQKHAFYFSILRIKEGLSHVQQPLFCCVFCGSIWKKPPLWASNGKNTIWLGTVPVAVTESERYCPVNAAVKMNRPKYSTYPVPKRTGYNWTALQGQSHTASLLAVWRQTLFSTSLSVFLERTLEMCFYWTVASFLFYGFFGCGVNQKRCNKQGPGTTP